MNQIEQMQGNEPIAEELWEDATFDAAESEGMIADPIPLRKDIFRRFKRNKLAFASAIVILVLYLIAIFGPLVMPYGYADQNLNNKFVPMLLHVRESADGTQFFLNEFGLYVVKDGGKEIVYQKETGIDPETRGMSYVYNNVEYLVKYDNEAGSLQLYDGATGDLIPESGTVWNKQNLLGTDPLGRDLLTRMVYGARISLSIGLVAAISTVIIGVFYGGISGYYGGNVDALMMRVLEVISNVPNMLYIIIMMVYFGPGIRNLIITIMISSWIGMARMVRGQVLTLKQHDYVLAAQAIGVSPRKIVLTHMVPNCMGYIVVSATGQIPGAIFTEAFLSFIGLGVAPPMPSWGSLCNEGLSSFTTYPAQVLIPAIAISITMFAFYFFGDGLRDAFDPQMRK